VQQFVLSSKLILKCIAMFVTITQAIKLHRYMFQCTTGFKIIKEYIYIMFGDNFFKSKMPETQIIKAENLTLHVYKMGSL
jgi:hypothetical protein